MLIINYKKNIFFVISILIIICSFILVIFNNYNSNYVLKVNEEKITKEEFETYLFKQKKVFEEKGGTDIWETDFDGLSAKEVAKQNTVNSIVLVKIAVFNAQKLNIYLTDEEEQSIIEEAKELQEEINSSSDINLSLKTAIKITKENKIEQKVFEYITHNFELSENDFNLYFNQYFNENKKYLTTVTGNIIFVEKSLENSQELVIEIYKKLVRGANISTIKNDYLNVDILENVILNEMSFEENVESQIYNLSEDSFSPVIEVNSGYYIFNILNIETEELESLKERLKEEYILNKKLEIYESQNEKWAKEFTITRNQEVWSKIVID